HVGSGGLASARGTRVIRRRRRPRAHERSRSPRRSERTRATSMAASQFQVTLTLGQAERSVNQPCRDSGAPWVAMCRSSSSLLASPPPGSDVGSNGRADERKEEKQR